VIVNFLWRNFSKGHSTETLYLQYVFGLASSTGLAGPQPAYLKMTTVAQRDRFCKSALPGHRHMLKVRRLMGS